MVLDPGDVREVVLTVTPGARLTGTVVDGASSRPIAAARVIVAEDALSTAPRAIVCDDRGNGGCGRAAHPRGQRDTLVDIDLEAVIQA